MTEHELAESLVGRTITRTLWKGEMAWLWLDDGRVIEFGAWGHDWWGATISEVRVVDVEKCLHCGKPHPDAEVCEGWEFKSATLPRDVPFAWCDDGHHAALILTVPR